MTPSPACEMLIKGFEQCRLTAYLPTPNDRPTLGWGSTGPDITLGMTWTQEEADARFSLDLYRFSEGVTNAITGDLMVPTTQNQFDAMVSLAYNIGMGGDNHPGFLTSTVLHKHNLGDYEDAANAFALWDKQKGIVLAGLVRRRAAEAAMYRGNP